MTASNGILRPCDPERDITAIVEIENAAWTHERYGLRLPYSCTRSEGDGGRATMMQNTGRHEIEELLEATRSSYARERNEALRVLCPCHVKFNDRRVWDRALEMVDDDDAKVRSTVLHLLCDGSPRERKDEVVEAVERMQHDADEKLRRRARKVMAEYRRTGKINVL